MILDSVHVDRIHVPSTTIELGEAIRSETGAMAPMGAGTELEFGNPLGPIDCAIDMRRLFRMSILKAFSLSAVAIVLAGCPGDPQEQQARAPQAPQVTVAKPVVKDIKEWDDFTGRFQAVEDVDIRARVTGYVKAIHFDEGELVKDGALLMTIDRRTYQAVLNEALAALKVAESALRFASQEMKRAENLSKRGNISRSIVDERREAFAAARAEIEGAKAAVQRAKLDLEFTLIRAPIAGRISSKRVSIGSLVSANETVLTNIASVDPIHFVFDVDERSYLAYARMAREGTRKSGRVTPYEVLVTLTPFTLALLAGSVLVYYLAVYPYFLYRLERAIHTEAGRGARLYLDAWRERFLEAWCTPFGTGVRRAAEWWHDVEQRRRDVLPGPIPVAEADRPDP